MTPGPVPTAASIVQVRVTITGDGQTTFVMSIEPQEVYLLERLKALSGLMAGDQSYDPILDFSILNQPIPPQPS